MKQVAQKQADGRLQVVDVPRPVVRSGGVLVRTGYSLISAGTERSAVEVARKSLLGKAKARPDQVRQVLNAARQQGLAETYQRVRSRLDQLTPLGYSSAGVVIEVGAEGGSFAVGDRVACAGAGYAAHAEYNFVPRNLCASAGSVPLDAAAFGTVGAIALQGVRQADVRVGESVAVIGLGLVGLLTVQILKAAGCRVLGVEPNDDRAELARTLGCDETAAPGDAAVEQAAVLTGGAGVDAVLITAATSSSAPVALAGELCRDRGTVVMVGATGMEVPRPTYYEKELDFRLSRSYGPGRYDPDYEEKGRDYPIGYVRWTQQRNLAAFLALVEQEKVRVSPLITHTFPIDRAGEAYDLITAGSEPHLAVLLEYALEEEAAAPPPDRESVAVADSAHREASGTGERAGVREGDIGIGMVGAGAFATGTLIPALSGLEDVRLSGIASASGLSARSAAENHDFGYAAPDAEALLDDPAVHALVVATRHDTHGPLVVRSVEREKPVFVEKPLAVSEEDLEAVMAAASGVSRPFVMVGFNRRFAPTTRSLVEFVAESREPVVMSYRVNAGFLPATHWLHDPAIGGGRIVGEGCHFVDLMMFLAGAPPVEVFARALPDDGRYQQDNVTVQLRFASGSVGTLTYLANGDRRVPKERLEVSGGGGTAILDDFRRVTLARGGKVRKTGRPWTRQDKGHRAELAAFVEAVRSGGESPIPLGEAAIVTETTFRILDSLRSGMPERVSSSF